MTNCKKTRVSGVRQRLTYANVMSTLAAFLGMGTGGAYAVDRLGKDSVGAQQIKAGAVRSAEVRDGSLTGRDLAPRAIGASRLATAAADSRAIRDGSLGERDIATGAVDSRAIRDGGIGPREIQDGSITPVDLSFRAMTQGALAGAGVSPSDLVNLVTTWSPVTSTQVTATNAGLLSLGNLNIANAIGPPPSPALPPPATVSYRVLIDGVEQGGTFSTTVGPGETVAAPVALLAPGIAPGTHTVELQARVDSGNAQVGARNLGAIAGVLGPSN